MNAQPSKNLSKAAKAIFDGNRQKSRQYLENDISQRSESLDAWLMRAWSCESFSETEEALRRVLDLDAGNTTALSGLEWMSGIQELAAQWDVRCEPSEESSEDSSCVAIVAEDEFNSRAVVIQQDAETEETQQDEAASQNAQDSEIDESGEVEIVNTDNVTSYAGGAVGFEDAKVESETDSAEFETEEAEIVSKSEVAPEATVVRTEQDDTEQFVAEQVAEAATEQVEVEQEVISEAESNQDEPVDSEASTFSEEEAAEAEAIAAEEEAKAARIAAKAEEAAEAARLAAEAEAIAAEEEAEEARIAAKAEEAEAERRAAELQRLADEAEATRAAAEAAELQRLAAEARASEARAAEARRLEEERIATETQAAAAAAAAAIAATTTTTAVEVEETIQENLDGLTAEVQESLQPAVAQPAASSVESDDAALVLAVDDSPTIRKLLTITLERQGFQVISAADGVEALTLLSEQLPDVILSDISMPRLGGYQLCKFVKKYDRTKHIPVIMLSGKDGVFDKMRGKMSGCNDYIVKPFESSELIAKVKQHAGIPV